MLLGQLVDATELNHQYLPEEAVEPVELAESRAEFRELLEESSSDSEKCQLRS